MRADSHEQPMAMQHLPPNHALSVPSRLRVNQASTHPTRRDGYSQTTLDYLYNLCK